MNTTRLYKEQCNGTLDKFLARQPQKQLRLLIRDIKIEMNMGWGKPSQRYIDNRNKMISKIEEYLE